MSGTHTFGTSPACDMFEKRIGAIFRELTNVFSITNHDDNAAGHDTTLLYV